MLRKLNVTKIVSLFVVLSLKYSCCEDVFIVVNDYKGSGYYCITNSSHALSWIIEDTTSSVDLQQGSRFLPVAENPWKVGCAEMRKSGWECQESLSDEIITDRRWENIEVHKINHVQEYYDLRFSNNLKAEDENFKIPLSIRTNREGYIFLCDGKRATSNCYCIILQGFGGTKSVIRKCFVNTNTQNNVKWNVSKVSIEHESESSTFLTNSRWQHFLLSKLNNKISLLKQNGQEIMSYMDNEGAYKIKNVLIHSRNTAGLWKIHKLESFTTNETKKIKIQPILSPTDDKICITTFVKMCELCKIKFVITNGDNDKQIFGQETYELKASKWTELKFVKHAFGAKRVKLAIITMGETSSDPHWAMQEIQQCGQNDLRMIYLKEKASCQLLTPNSKLISLDNVVEPSYSDKYTRCAENTISTHCIPCGLFLNESCGKLKICENIRTELRCSCSSGYKTDNQEINCQINCDSGTYGHYCRKTCSTNCLDCNSIDGTCTNCSNGYKGSKCDKEPVPVFKNAPKIEARGYTAAEILVDNFELDDALNNSVYEYTVQYKEANSMEWILHTHSANGGTPHIFKIENLKPETQYSVRSIIGKYETHYDDDVPKTDFITKCDVLKSEDLQVEATNITAVLLVKKDRHSRICKFISSETSIEIQPSTIIFSYYLGDMNVTLSGLIPFQNFNLNLTIYNTNTVVTISFSTTEGVPRRVTNLATRATRNSEIVVNWNAPRNLYGHLRDFLVSYKINNYYKCDATSNEEITKTTTNSSITLSNLNPGTRYSISVKARNAKFAGQEETAERYIPESSIIRDHEIPTVSLKQTSNRSIEISFSNISCSKLGGPLHVVTTATCLTDWCKDEDVSNGFLYPWSNSYTLSSLSPFTTYQLKIKFRRSASSKIVTFGTFQTKPEPPYGVSNLSVYSKNAHSISIRWFPPQPPTGILKLYHIKFADQDGINVTNSSCSLWPEYQCYTLEKLKEKRNYSVELRAKNEEPDSFGQVVSVWTFTETEPSEKPPEVRVKWTLENDLDISWKHPVVANGDLQSFKIDIVPKCSSTNERINTSLDITIDEYKSTYQKTVKIQHIQSSTEYKIVVKAYNGLDGQEASVTDVSPPEIPLLETAPTITNVSNNTITLQVNKSKNFNNTNTYKLFLLVSNNSPNSVRYPWELRNFESNFGISLSLFRVVYECDDIITEKRFVIGQSGNVSGCNYSDIFLTARSSYNVTVMLVSSYQNKSSYKFYSQNAFTTNEIPNAPIDLSLLGLWLLLLIIPVVVIIIIHHLQNKKTLVSSEQGVGSCNLASSAMEKRVALNNSQYQPIPNEKFNSYVETNLESKKLITQHNTILLNSSGEYEEVGDKTYLEYIDIQFTSGHHIPKVYAISEMPKDFDRFWKLVWNENIEHIVLMDSAHFQQIRKNYWPKFGLSSESKHVSVHCIHEEILTDHEYRTFRLTYQNEIRLINQLRFTAWTDFDLPHSLTFVNFFKKMSVMSLNRKSPILVHCSTTRAGTGFALLCDMCLRISKKDNVVDVFKNSQILKDSNLNLIDSYNCYQLAHLVILECLLSSELDVEMDLLDDKSERSVLYEKELKKYLTYMKDTAWIDQLSPDKNRDSNIYFRVDAPRYEGELLLRPYSPDEEIDSFLSSLDGVIIDDCSCPKKYILLKHPQQDNLEQFWTMVSKVDVSVIINLNENDFFGANLLLNQGGLQVSNTLILKLVNVTHFKCYDWITVRVLIDGQKHSKDVKIFWMKNWSGEVVCPPSVKDFVEFCIETTSVTAACNSVLITCCDGATASGLYVAMSYNIENIKKEKKSVISTSARLVRRYRHQFATKEEQLKFLWEATEFYMQQHNLYEIC
ncbi:receptor-type tyrosine-protein phosphatase delta-like [Zophobas morio]|uniref:receptor-type tyrosine-protein phosphatase delta-like n=1 Tax=Zophobas morio TaxID=2755281 RepID=UPI0030828827